MFRPGGCRVRGRGRGRVSSLNSRLESNKEERRRLRVEVSEGGPGGCTVRGCGALTSRCSYLVSVLVKQGMAPTVCQNVYLADVECEGAEGVVAQELYRDRQVCHLPGNGGGSWFINSQTPPLYASEGDETRRQGSNSL